MLNPFTAKMESQPGKYQWTSALERLKIRSLYYLHKLPIYFEVQNWWEYLTENIELEDIWSTIRSATVSGKPLGDFKFSRIIKGDYFGNSS